MDIPLSGLRAAAARMGVSAHNVANVNTAGFRSYRAVQSEQPTGRGTRTHVVRTETPTDLATEMVEQLVSVRYAEANGTVVRYQMEMQGSILDLFA